MASRGPGQYRIVVVAGTRMDLQFRREPRPLKYSHLGPFRRGPIMLCGQMLRQRGQKHIPPLIASGGWLITQQRQLNVVRLPAVLLKKLPHKLPAGLGIIDARQAPAKVSQGHRPVARHSGSEIP